MKALMFLTIVLFSAQTIAQVKTRTVVKESFEYSEAPYEGPALFIGPEIHSLRSISVFEDEEGDKSGTAYGFKADVSWLKKDWTFDVGVGWHSSRIEGDEVSENDTFEVESSYGVANLGARYRLGMFELGPTINVLFGTDVSFAPTESTVESATDNQVFGGFTVYYGGYHWGDFDNRIGLTAMTDLTIDDRQVTFIGLNFQFAIPMITERPKTKVVQMVETIRDVQIKKETKIVEKRAYFIDGGVINFPTDKSKLDNRDYKYLRHLGAFLKENKKFWKQIVITGHADKRGGQIYNEKLALERANSVINAMELQELPPKRFKVISKGYQEPVAKKSNQMQWARDRRVEVEVTGAKLTRKLKKYILRIRQQHSVPDTCSEVDGKCK